MDELDKIKKDILEAKYIKKCRYVADINDLEDMDDGDPIPGGIPGPEKDKTGRYYLIQKLVRHMKNVILKEIKTILEGIETTLDEAEKKSPKRKISLYMEKFMTITEL